MRDTSCNLNLDPDEALPLYLRIARAVVRAIETGLLKPGEPLPGSRVLARYFKVNRNTILAALSLLEAQGWVETSPNRGTFVSATAPAEPSLGRGIRVEATPTPFLWTRTQDGSADLYPEGHLDLREGIPDPRLLSVAELAKHAAVNVERANGGRAVRNRGRARRQSPTGPLPGSPDGSRKFS